MVRRFLLVLTLVATGLVVGAAPAQAIPPGDNLVVVAYYDSAARVNLVGQKWWGCGQPSGSWGTTSAYSTLFFTPC